MSEERQPVSRGAAALGVIAAVATIIGTIIAFLQFIEPSEEARPAAPPTSAQTTGTAQEYTLIPEDGPPRDPGNSTGPAVDVEPDIVRGDGVFVVSGEGFDMLGVTLNWVMDTGETKTISPFVAVDGNGRFRWSGLLPTGSDPCGHSGRIEAWSPTQVTTLAATPFSVEC